MALSFAGNGTITGLSVGGLPDGTVDGDTLASGVGGKILQVVNVTNSALATGTTQILHDDSIPQNTEGTEYMTLAITPSNVNNKLIIHVVFCHAVNGSSAVTMGLFQDSTANALAGVHNWEATNIHSQLVLTHYMTAGTTSATTFKVRAGCESTNTLTFNGINGGRRLGGVSSSGITIMEVGA